MPSVVAVLLRALYPAVPLLAAMDLHSVIKVRNSSGLGVHASCTPLPNGSCPALHHGSDGAVCLDGNEHGQRSRHQPCDCWRGEARDQALPQGYRQVHCQERCEGVAGQFVADGIGGFVSGFLAGQVLQHGGSLQSIYGQGPSLMYIGGRPPQLRSRVGCVGEGTQFGADGTTTVITPCVSFGYCRPVTLGARTPNRCSASTRHGTLGS